MTHDPFAPLLGQQQAIELLTQAVTQNRVAPAYLFVGSDGVGRSLAARCFVELLFSSSVETRLIASLQSRLR
ncbi:MAG: DNA polymerase III subunit delta', partial [Scytonema sp. CRU_2_7]|nr:DNA polymerase III subunit delta' [Scytonema sp. CRU_2_7]